MELQYIEIFVHYLEPFERTKDSNKQEKIFRILWITFCQELQDIA